MTALFTLGRCEFAEGPTSIDQAGSTVTLSGDLWCDTYAELTARRFQLLGMVANPDEDVFPLYSDDDALSYLNGFYRVLDASVGSTPVMSESATVPYSLTLEAVTDYATPRIESYLSALLTTNGLGITSGRTYFTGYLKSAWREPQISGLFTITGFGEREAEEGTVRQVYADSGTSGTLSVVVDPANYYDCGARIEFQGADSTWYEWTGRSVPPDTADKWRLSNGLVRITSNTWEVWDSGAWRSVALQVVGKVTAGASVYPTNIGQMQAAWGTPDDSLLPTIMRNDRDCVVLSFGTAPGSESTSANGQTTVTLRSGAMFAALSFVGVQNRYGVMLAGGTAAMTAITGGGRLTSNDANGNRWLIAATQPMTVEAATEGNVARLTTQVTAATKALLCVGWEFGGSSATGDFTAAEVVEQFIVNAGATTRIIAR